MPIEFLNNEFDMNLNDFDMNLNDFDMNLNNEFDIFMLNNSFYNITSQNSLNHIPPIPISDICFYENSLVYTDQGIISINKINPNKHTINNNKIVAITKTISFDNYLICFKKHSLGFNYPNSDIILSKNHKILYGNNLIPAYKFLNNFKNVVQIKYKGEILYNILFKKYTTIIVNNLVCETLHPNNFVSKIINSKLSNDRKHRLIILLNTCIIKNYFDKYNKIIHFIEKMY